jgi:hypothetical protein
VLPRRSSKENLRKLHIDPTKENVPDSPFCIEKKSKDEARRGNTSGPGQEKQSVLNLYCRVECKRFCASRLPIFPGGGFLREAGTLAKTE